jgi:hypothetical protein
MREISAGDQSKIRVRGSSSEDPSRGSSKITALIVVSHCGRIRLNLTSRTSYPTTAVQQSRALIRVEVVLHCDTRKKNRIRTIAAAQPITNLCIHKGSRHHRYRSAKAAPVSRPRNPMVMRTCMRRGQPKLETISDAGNQPAGGHCAPSRRKVMPLRGARRFRHDDSN